MFSSPKDLPQLPIQLAGFWKIGDIHYEIRVDGRFFQFEELPLALSADNMSFTYKGKSYYRLFGESEGISGVWRLSTDPSIELSFREDGTYSSHNPVMDAFGEYSYDKEKGSVFYTHLRTVIIESEGVLTFYPQFGPTQSGNWQISESTLRIEFTTGVVAFEIDKS